MDAGNTEPLGRENTMKENHSSLLFIIDRSGSMAPLVDDTIGGFNTVLAENKEVEGTADVTLVLFDHEFEKPVDHVDIKEVSPLDRGTYVPRGMTAMLDAIGMAVSEEIGRQAALSDDEKPEKTIVTIITDGQENASKEWGYDKVKNLLSTVQNENRWVVSFLGANIDAAKEAANIGIRASMSSNYVADSIGTGAVYSSVSKMQQAVRGMSAAAFYDASDDAFESSMANVGDQTLGDVREDFKRRSGK